MRARGSVLVAGAAVVGLLHGRAEAAPDKQACVDAYGTSQELRQAGKLREAREQLAVCANAACPSVARVDCARWLAEVERELPSLLLQPVDEGNKPIEGARAWLDGAPLGERIDPAPMAVDPGAHTVRIEARGFEPVEQKFTLRSGEKSRVITARMKATRTPLAPPPEPMPTKSATPVGAIAFGLVGLAGLGAFTYLGLTGREAQRELDACKPRCLRADAEAVQQRYLFANVGLGVGVVGLGVATFLLATRRPEPPPATVRLDVDALPGGGVATLGGAF